VLVSLGVGLAALIGWAITLLVKRARPVAEDPPPAPVSPPPHSARVSDESTATRAKH